jgi:hypothetical protein
LAQPAQEIGEPLLNVIYIEGGDFHLRTEPPLTHITQTTHSGFTSESGIQ